MRTFYISFFLFLLIFNYSCKNEVRTQTLHSHPINEDYPSIAAHRGGKNIKGYPENCLETIQYLYEKGIRMFEIDIQQTKDNRVVLMHDKSLERTTTGVDYLSKLSWQSLRTLRLTDDFGNTTDYHIPLLKTVLEWAAEKQDVFLELDLKDVSYDRLRMLLHGYNSVTNRIILIAYSQSQAEELANIFPKYHLSVPMRNSREFERMMTSKIPKNKMLAFTGTRRSAPELYRKIKAQNIPVIFGSLGNIDQQAARKGDEIYREFFASGVDILATDRPLEVQKARIE